MSEEQKQILCPKCGSNQITAHKKGYSVAKGAAGLLIPGGLLWGFAGSRKIKITCLGCGHKFKPGEGVTTSPHITRRRNRKKKHPGCTTVMIAIGFILAMILIKACS